MTVEEAPTRIEPARIEYPAGELLDLSLEIVARAERLGRALHPETAAQLARTVRIMNTYYSNLIEGHNTRPREIEQALHGINPEDDRRDLKIGGLRARAGHQSLSNISMKQPFQLPPTG